MIRISFIAGELAFTAVWLAVRIVGWIRRKKIDWKREAALLLMYVNLAVIIRLVFYPFFTVGGKVQPLIFDPGKILPPRVNLVPFVHIAEYDSAREMMINIAGNIVMFIPGGIILPLLYRRLDGFFKVVVASAGISAAVEILQLLFYGSVTDIDDLILNTAGAAAGCGIYFLFRAASKAFRDRNKAENIL